MLHVDPMLCSLSNLVFSCSKTKAWFAVVGLFANLSLLEILMMHEMKLLVVVGFGVDEDDH